MSNVPRNRLGTAVHCVAAAKLLLHLYAGRQYGYFVDELYYLACSRHLAMGYVDQPPLIAWLTWAWTSMFGDSLTAIRLLPALAGAAEVILTALLARELGGGRFAQLLAAIAVLVAPGILGTGNLLTMNAFEPLFWLGCAYLTVRIVRTGNQKLWIWFGILAGFGLLNKYSMAIFGAGIVFGILLSPHRKCLLGRWIWIGGGIALFIFHSNLVWNLHHGFPFFELQENIRRSGRDAALGLVTFFGQETLTMHPLTLPLWLAGLWFYFSKAGKEFRMLGWAWVFTAFVIVVLSPRIYYLFPAFPLLFAAGGVMLEGVRWLRVAYPALLIATGAVLAPLAIPLLTPTSYVAYSKALGIGQPKLENHALGPLPQIFADQFGWEEMVREVARVYHSLPPEVRSKTAIFGQNYGQAGAIDLFGPRYGLPPAISGHQNYFFWGPRDYNGESVIVLDDRRENLELRFANVEKVGRVHHPYSMPYQHFDVFYCQGLAQPLKDLWPQLKKWQ